MGRPKKVAAQPIATDSEIREAVEEAKKDPQVVVTTVEASPKVKESHKLYAWFAYIDKEGFKVKAEFKSEGETVEEALAALEFPKGVNRLTNATYTHNGNEFSRALAPHVARKLFEDKDSFEFGRLFKGV